MRAKLGCSAGPQGWEMSWLRNLRTRLKMLWMMFMAGAAFSVSRPLGARALVGVPGRTPSCPPPSPPPPAQTSPEHGLVQILGMGTPDLLQVTHCCQPGPELTPGDMQDLIGDVALDDFHEVLHLVLE